MFASLINLVLAVSPSCQDVETLYLESSCCTSSPGEDSVNPILAADLSLDHTETGVESLPEEQLHHKRGNGGRI